MILSEQIRLIRSSGHMHGNWYRSLHPEVDMLEITPAEHYIRFGAAMLRDPGKNFDTKFYLEQYPDLVESGMNPLLHYVLSGKDDGAETYRRGRETRQIASARTKLLSLGFTERPLEELSALQDHATAPEIRAAAARELAFWYFRMKTPEAYGKALAYLAAARADAPDLDFRRKLAVTELLCHFLSGDLENASASLERAILAGESTPDLILAAANLQTDVRARLDSINRVMDQYGLAPLCFLEDETLPPYDRLTSATPLPKVVNGPKVSVLIAAYECETTLPTALRSLQEQTWQNLEILVLDDCSPGDGTARVARDFAKGDPRIRFIRMPENGGAYVARNHGLDEATGEYVTLHDADDWSHPLKIETQVSYLIAHPDKVGCLSEQARVFDDLTFARLAGHGSMLISNTSSFMFDKIKMKECAGYWDTVRFSADNELIRRVRKIHGRESVEQLATGPLSFQRDSATSIIADAIMGINGFFFGARKEYLDAQTYHRGEHPDRLAFGNEIHDRQFPAPVLMLPNRKQIAERFGRLDTVIAADLRGNEASIDDVLEAIGLFSGTGFGVFEMNRYDPPSARTVPAHMSHAARAAIWRANARILTFGEDVPCKKLIIWGPDILQESQRYLPAVHPEAVTIVLTDAVLDRLGGEGQVADALSVAERRARTIFGREPQWQAAGPCSLDVLTALKLPLAPDGPSAGPADLQPVLPGKAGGHYAPFGAAAG